MPADPKFEAILDEYREHLPQFREEALNIRNMLQDTFDQAGLTVAGIEQRVKTEKSLAGKLELKGGKYQSLKDITDIIGLRVITFYIDDVDKVASAIERLFTIDWENSVDKRMAHEVDSFGYLSLHYICSKTDFPYRFEIQMRTVLQHAWANMNHDTGYKSGVEVPTHYLRNINRLAGMLELIDEQFSLIRSELTDYRRRVKALVASGNLDDVSLDGDSFRDFLELDPFGQLNRRIATVNQAEIQEVITGKDERISFKPKSFHCILDVLYCAEAGLVCGCHVVHNFHVSRGPFPEDPGEFVVRHHCISVSRSIGTQVVQKPVQYRLPFHLQERFREILCQRIKAGSIARCEDQAIHMLTPFTVSQTWLRYLSSRAG